MTTKDAMARAQEVLTKARAAEEVLEMANMNPERMDVAAARAERLRLCRRLEYALEDLVSAVVMAGGVQ